MGWGTVSPVQKKAKQLKAYIFPFASRLSCTWIELFEKRMVFLDRCPLGARESHQLTQFIYGKALFRFLLSNCMIPYIKKGVQLWPTNSLKTPKKKWKNRCDVYNLLIKLLIFSLCLSLWPQDLKKGLHIIVLSNL